MYISYHVFSFPYQHTNKTFQQYLSVFITYVILVPDAIARSLCFSGQCRQIIALNAVGWLLEKFMQI